jgi:hypothetical protein
LDATASCRACAWQRTFAISFHQLRDARLLGLAGGLDVDVDDGLTQFGAHTMLDAVANFVRVLSGHAGRHERVEVTVVGPGPRGMCQG